jgi:predicted ArsR family transcriptional regulator
MTSLQQQARALGDPTRHGIFRYILDAGDFVDVAELTDHFGLNHNAIRQHLAKLLDAELVEESTAPTTGPGRPRLVYLVAPAAESRWGATGPYERLSLLLADMIRTGDPAVEVGRRAGRQFPVASAPEEDTVRDIAAAMARQGFEPEIQTRKRGTEVVLTTCPFASTVLADRETICALHLGIAEGLAEGTGLSIHQLVAKDPRRAGCRVRLTSATSADQGTTGDLVLVGRISASPRRPDPTRVSGALPNGRAGGGAVAR